jgi:hypothetical protein
MPAISLVLNYITDLSSKCDACLSEVSSGQLSVVTALSLCNRVSLSTQLAARPHRCLWRGCRRALQAGPADVQGRGVLADRLGARELVVVHLPQGAIHLAVFRRPSRGPRWVNIGWIAVGRALQRLEGGELSCL